MNISDYIAGIKPANKTAYTACQMHWNQIAKPIGSLGELEHLLNIIAGASGTADICIGKKCVMVFCGDNGVLAQGVAQSTHEVTTAIARSLVRGTTSVNAMAASCGAKVFPIDMGMKEPVEVTFPEG